MRGEIGWLFAGPDLFAQNATNGVWFHNLIWAGLHAGGLIEHYWTGSPTQDHLYKAGSHDHRPVFRAYYAFIKDIPLNNGHYEAANATASMAEVRVWGQKDRVHGRAHLWLQHAQHTWKNIVDGVPIAPLTASITLPGMSPNSTYVVEWWDTSTGAPSHRETLRTDSGGNLVLQVTNLATDIAVRIGDYTTPVRPDKS
jgi:hypothetical protein